MEKQDRKLFLATSLFRLRLLKKQSEGRFLVRLEVNPAANQSLVLQNFLPAGWKSVGLEQAPAFDFEIRDGTCDGQMGGLIARLIEVFEDQPFFEKKVYLDAKAPGWVTNLLLARGLTYQSDERRREILFQIWQELVKIFIAEGEIKRLREKLMN